MTCVPVSLERKYTWDLLHHPFADVCALTVFACEHRLDAIALRCAFTLGI